MILVFNLDYRSSSQVYEKIFLQTLNAFDLKGVIEKKHFALNLYVEARSAEVLEAFVTKFSSELPQSIFLYGSEAQIVEKMPKDTYVLNKEIKLSLPFCPSCLKEVMDDRHKNYYNIFTHCDICGYGIEGENRSYKKEFEEAAKAIAARKVVQVNTFYGSYFVGIPAQICNDIDFDIVSYDLASIEKYANVESYEITTLGAMEKPLVKLKKKIQFSMDHEEVESDLLRFKLPDDFVLHLLMEELHDIGIDAIFITEEEIDADESFILVESEENFEPIEVVASENNVAIVSGEKGLPKFSVYTQEVNPGMGSFFSVIKEHQLNDENVAGLNLSKEFNNTLLVHGQKYGTIEYLSFNFEFDSMQEIFDKIIATNDSGKKIVENFKAQFPEHFDSFIKIKFNNKTFNIFKLWGIVSIVLDYTNTKDLLEAAQKLEENAMSFLGTKGPRIDYKLHNVKGKVEFDPLMTIRTAMSFKLAGVDPLMLSYGVIESFLEFLANELDEVKQSMDITAVTVTGSLLGNKHMFSKMSKEISKNHNIYFNNELPVDGRNMFYGGVSPEK